MGKTRRSWGRPKNIPPNSNRENDKSMSATFLLIIRGLMAATLYVFLGIILFTLWRDFQRQQRLLAAQAPPPLGLRPENAAAPPLYFSGVEIMIGRDLACEYSLDDITVSAQHARLSFRQGQWWVEDLDSTNGTFLNQEKVRQPTVITNGDLLRCGQVTLRISIETISDWSNE